MNLFLFIWYAVVVIAGLARWISFPLFAANLITVMVLALIFVD